MKIMIVNSKAKIQNNFGKDQKSSSWFYSWLCYYIYYYMRKYPIHVTWAQGKTSNTLCLTWESNLKKVDDKQFTTVTTQKKKCSKLFQLKMYI